MLLGLKLKNIIFILFGAGIFAFGLVHFNMQNNLAEGGFTGLTLIIYQLIGINPSYSNLVLNIPLFLIGWKYLGRTSFFYTIIGTVGLSVWLWVFERYQIEIDLGNDLMLVALFAGVFCWCRAGHHLSLRRDNRRSGYHRPFCPSLLGDGNGTDDVHL